MAQRKKPLGGGRHLIEKDDGGLGGGIITDAGDNIVANWNHEAVALAELTRHIFKETE